MTPNDDERTTAGEIAIKVIDASRLDDLRELWRDAQLDIRPTGRDSLDELAVQIHENPTGFIGAYTGERLVGFVMATDDGRRGWINRIAVHSEYLRTGVASTLIAAAEVELKRRGLRIIAVLVEDANKASLRLFESTGFLSMPDVVYLSKRENPDV